MLDTYSSPPSRYDIGGPIVAVLALSITVGCPGDGSDGDDQIPVEPRQADELPGGDIPAGADPCGDEPDCSWSTRGDGGDGPLELTPDSDAIADGDAATLDDEPVHTHVAWVPNTGGDTVSRIDLEQRLETARYRTGPGPENLAPAHTSVRSDGGVYVANRDAETAVYIALAPECPNLDDGDEPTTSTGSDDLLDWGDDDCVVWETELSGHGDLEGIAAHDDDGDSRVWVAGTDETIWRVDGDDGSTDFRTDAPLPPAGLAIDKETDSLWIAGDDGRLGRIDTDACRDHGSCETDICGVEGDDCTKQVVDPPGDYDGLALDDEGRVWLGGDDLMRYDPAAPTDERWTSFSLDDFVSLHGVAYDEAGWIYATGGGDGVYRFSADDPSNQTAIPSTAGRSARGIDIDSLGYVWTFNPDHNDAFVIDPGPGLFDAEVDETITGFDTPDVYRDVTGHRVRYPVDAQGTVRATFQACDPKSHEYTEWQTLRFAAETDDDSELRWRVRAADYAAELEASQWLDIGTTPPTESPVDLRSILASAGLARAEYIEIEVELRPSQSHDDDFAVPRLDLIDVVSTCPAGIP